jgi:tetratricopeptide (TPR) repeat protein
LIIAMPILQYVTPLFSSDDAVPYVAYGAIGAALACALFGLWLGLGRGPRRSRAYKRARRLLAEGTWEPALAIVSHLQERAGPSPRWQGLLNRLEGECCKAAGQEGLRAKQFERSHDLFLRAASLLGQDPQHVRVQIVEAMLAEVRRLLSASSKTEIDTVLGVIGRIFPIQSPCPEASFWQGICQLKKGDAAQAIASFQQARAGKEDNNTVQAREREGAGNGSEAEKTVQDRGDMSQERPAQGDSRKAVPAASPRPRVPASFIDPPLYLGALLLREGRPEDAVRYLSEANRLDANCPFVTWQLGTAMLAAGGECLIAVKALQRALGPRGLEMWKNTPSRAWVEGFPEKISFVRRLAAQHPFQCPLFGSEVAYMIRQGQIALGQGQYRLGNFEEAAKIFTQLLQEGAPALPILRGLGLALARLDRYDQAFKHLRTAYEMEDPKDPLTAGYLALCGAKGKPTRPEDKEKNVLWAIRLVGKLSFPQNAEWAKLLSHLFAEARSASVAVPREDQERLCDVLVSVDAIDPLAAAAYAELATALLETENNGKVPRHGHAPTGRHGDTELRKSPDTEVDVRGVPLRPGVPAALQALRPECAWLYCRAAQQHGLTYRHDLELFALAFATEAEARGFYGQRRWDFDEMELIYLEHSAAQRPGEFPESLGSNYPARGERLLLERSHWLENLEDKEGARACAEVLLKLAPRNTAAYDRMAQLAYRAADLDRAAHLLESWHQLAPNDPLPVARRAVIEHQRGNHAGRVEAIKDALRLARGKNRAEIAFLGARLALQEWLDSTRRHEGAENRNGDTDLSPVSLARKSAGQVLELLDECLREQPEHEAALWCKAAVACHLGRYADLRGLAAVLGRLENARDPRLHFLAAVCHLAAEEHGRVPAAARQAAEKSPGLAGDCQYLVGRAAFLGGDAAAATQALRQPGENSGCLSKGHAQALLGRICFSQGRHEEAIAWWKSLEPARRKAWGFDEPLRGTLFVSALESFQADQFEEAAEKIREAGRLGLRERRLGSLLALALIKAGQKLLYS